jgi:uncharacterized phage protein gp47/JayE
MAGPYGVTLTGFNRKHVTAIKADIEAFQRAEISPALDLSTYTPWGQNNGIVSNEIGVVWEQLEICAHAMDPDAAQGFLLESLCKLTGTERRGASYSVVPLTCDLDAGTTLESAIHFAAVDGNPESLWTPVEDYTAETDGNQVVQFRAEIRGPVPAASETITVIHTSVGGWNSVTNDTDDVEVGRDIDTEQTLRQRREEQLTAPGSGTPDAIRSDLLDLDGVITAEVFENDSDEWVDGMSPHSLEALIFDGETPAVDNDTIAQVLWNARGGGIKTIGSVTGNAVDAKGNTRVMRFSRPTFKQVYIEIEIETGSGYVGDTAVKAYIASKCTELHGIDDDVRVRRIDSLVFDLGGVIDVTDFKLGFGASPDGTTNLSIGAREIASFDTSRITVTT